MYRWLRNTIIRVIWDGASRLSDGQDKSEMLRRLLRRYPTWSWGHRLLAENSLTRDNIGLAYAASLCYRELTQKDSADFAHAHFLLGSCFLRRGDWRSALHHLKIAHSISPSVHEITEELAAAHMLAEDYSTAAHFIQAIPEASRSAQAKAALSFAATRLRT